MIFIPPCCPILGPQESKLSTETPEDFVTGAESQVQPNKCANLCVFSRFVLDGVQKVRDK